MVDFEQGLGGPDGLKVLADRGLPDGIYGVVEEPRHEDPGELLDGPSLLLVDVPW